MTDVALAAGAHTAQVLEDKQRSGIVGSLAAVALAVSQGTEGMGTMAHMFAVGIETEGSMAGRMVRILA